MISLAEENKSGGEMMESVLDVKSKVKLLLHDD